MATTETDDLARATAGGLASRLEAAFPSGAQIIGPYLEDRTTIAFAGLIEKAFGGFRPAPGY